MIGGDLNLRTVSVSKTSSCERHFVVINIFTNFARSQFIYKF